MAAFAAFTPPAPTLEVTTAPPLYVGQPVEFRFTYYSPPNIAAPPSFSINPGDGAPNSPLSPSPIPGTSESSATYTHVYAAAGTYTAHVVTPDNTTVARANVVILAQQPCLPGIANVVCQTPPPRHTPPPRPTPSPTATPKPSASPSVGQVQRLSMTWPNGQTTLSLLQPSIVPHPVAHFTMSGPATLQIQWQRDGIPQATQTVTLPAGDSNVEYTGLLPPQGNHKITLVVLSPPLPAFAPLLTNPSIDYAFGASPPPVAVAPKLLHFEGFDVDDLHATQAGDGTLSGDGRAHIADFHFRVTFNGITIGNPKGDGEYDVLSGSASFEGATKPINPRIQPVIHHARYAAISVSDVSRAQSARTVEIAASVNKGIIHLGPFSCPTMPENASQFPVTFPGEDGKFTKFDYPFSVMSVTLNAKGTPSQADLCYAPYGIETWPDGALEGINNADYAGGAIGLNGQPIPGPQQMVVTLSKVGIDQDGSFTQDVKGDSVGPYRLGYSAFRVLPTAAQSLQLRFRNSDGAPHVQFNGTPFAGAGILQSTGKVTGKVGQCAWDPQGVDATFSIDPTTIYLNAPSNFSLGIGANALQVIQSLFAGGTMSGTYAAGQTAPPAQVGNLRISALGALSTDSAVSSAVKFDQGQVAASAGDFVAPASAINQGAISGSGGFNSAASAPNPFTISLPSGNFNGVYTPLGDLVADATSSTIGLGQYSITPKSASLYVPGGQVSYGSQSDFVDYVNGLAKDPMWDPANAPDLSTGVPIFNRAAVVITALEGVAGGQASSISRFSGALSGLLTSPSTSAGSNAIAFGGLNLSVAAQSVIATAVATAITNALGTNRTPKFDYPGLYVDSGTVVTPFSSVTTTFDASAKGYGFGFVFVDGGGISGQLSARGHVSITYKHFPVDLQIFNVLFLDNSILRTNIWGDLVIPPPIDAHLPVSVQGSDIFGDLGAAFVSKGANVPLTGWKSAFKVVTPWPINDYYISAQDGALTVPGLSSNPEVAGDLLSSGTVRNSRLVPLNASDVERLAQVDFTPTDYKFDAGVLGSVDVEGTGTIAGWTPKDPSAQLDFTNATGDKFAPNPGSYGSDTLTLTRSVGGLDLSVILHYDSGKNAWNGGGRFVDLGFIDSYFYLNVDDSSQKAKIGLDAYGADPSIAGDLGKLNGSTDDIELGKSDAKKTGFVKISGAGDFDRNSTNPDDIIDWSITAQMTLAEILKADVGFGYGNPPGDMSVLTGTCVKASWCITGHIHVGLGDKASLDGGLEAVFNHVDFELYASGGINSPATDFHAEGQGGYNSAEGTWNFGLSAKNIPILGGIVELDAGVCVWNQEGSSANPNCLSYGVKETGWGFYFDAAVHKSLGPISAKVEIHVQVISDNGGFGAGLYLKGSVDLGVISADAEAHLNFQVSPPKFWGTASIDVCVIAVKATGTLGVTLDSGGFHIDKAGISFDTCGVLGWL